MIIPPASFYIGAARWRMSLERVASSLAAAADVNDPDSIHVLTATPYGFPRQVRSAWRHHLLTAQNGQCFWCGHHLGRGTTWEHVVPYQSAAWATLTRMEQLLILRLSHIECNTAYNTWRLASDLAALHTMDHRLVRQTQRTIRRHPILWLYQSHHYRPTAMV